MYWSQFVEIFKTDNTRRNQEIYIYIYIHTHTHTHTHTYLCKGKKKRSPSVISFEAPFVFIIHKNDLHLNIQDAKLVLFADDINILIINKNIDAVQASLNRTSL